MTDRLSPTGRLHAELYAPVTAEAAGSKATLRVFGRIDADGAPWGVSSTDVQAALDTLTDDVTDVEVQVQTRGGDAFEGVAIMNMIRALPQNTEAVVVGLAASAGSYIVQGADKVTMMPHSQMMIHRGSVLALGQAPDMRMAADRLESIDKTMANVYTEKAGGSPDEWLAAMTPETWYTADEAVAAGLADGVRPMPRPADAKASLDLSVFAYAGRDHAPAPFIPAAKAAPQTPAEPPVTPPTENKEADTMSDTLSTGLRKRLGVADDADEATVLAALDEALAEQAEPATPPAATTPDAAAITAALAADGKIAVSENVLAELRTMAEQGVQARAKQLAEERDDTIQAAFNDGKISKDRKAAWLASWDKDPEGTKADLESLPARFPVGEPKGHQSDGANVNAEVMTDDEAAALAAMTGTSKEALIHG